MDKQNLIIIAFMLGSLLLSVSLFLLTEAARSYFYNRKQPRQLLGKRRTREEEKIIVSPSVSPAERYELQQELEELKELRKDHIISEQEFKYQIGLMLGKHNGTGSPKCRKTEEDKEVDELVRLKKEGLLTEAAFRREFDKIKFRKYL